MPSKYGVNDAGQVVGASSAAVPDARRHGYLYAAGRMSDLHPLISLGGAASFAAGISTSGQIVGASTVDLEPGLGRRHAFVYRNGKLTDLHPAVSRGGVWSEALGINDLGDIVGAFQVADGDCYHAFLLRGGDNSVSDLHSFVQGGGCSSRANGVNDQGDIVGSATSAAAGFRAFLYAGGVATDLNSLIPPDSGWVLEFANGISRGGHIVGFGKYMDQPRAFLLTQAGGTSVPPAVSPGDRVLTVSEVLGSQDQYVGQRIAVKGKVQIAVDYSLLPCPDNVPDCTPIIGVGLFLQDLDDGTKRLPIYQSGSPYRCSYDIRGNYDCRQFVNNNLMVLDGVYTKGKEPDLVIGTSSPGGGSSPPQVVKFRDFYSLDVTPSAKPTALGAPSASPPRARGRGK